MCLYVFASIAMRRFRERNVNGEDTVEREREREDEVRLYRL